MSRAPNPRLRLRLVIGAARFGPGKADLLEAIRDTGSIAAAGRRLGMSYKRAWSLVEEMNDAWRAPLVACVRGGAQGGGAALTGQGAQVLSLYRRLEHRAALAGADEIAALADLLGDMSDGK
ncbi:DNA-binding protein domain protein of ModE [Roseibacterium elongatum DSM 19469]|uniref:DNA-binding protein domain protein of ModE n=1 Tax=Roseicyclus elongatus DSM 19469 TaxID=1294273 RepID=W8RTX2_9RHOB|nr:LysR family transcriptional regulator [Roseibacterium elongatum]AHM04669.1 DNA-binding protein domain protein of ModE [Roseibacterium elongatum DSM 19469]